MLTFEGQAVQGIEAIIEKFKVRSKPRFGPYSC